MKILELSDTQKWARFKSGDEFALSVIYSENAKSLFQYGLKFTSNYVIIEDAIQNLFSDLIRNRKTIGDTNHIQFYLLKSFRRKLIRQLNYESRFTNEQVDELMFDVKYSVEQDIISKEEQQNISKHLVSAIKKLSPRQKEAIYLKFTKELDYKEISQLLNIEIEASRNLVYRAIKSLKNSIEETYTGHILLFVFESLKYRVKISN